LGDIFSELSHQIKISITCSLMEGYVSECESTNHRYRILLIVTGCIGTLAVILFLWVWFGPYTWTRDAYTQGNPVEVTPFHEGIVTSIMRDDTFLVHQGDLLVQLDPTDYQIALARNEEALAQQVRNVCSLFQSVFVAQAALFARRAELIYAREDFRYKAAVVGVGAVSVDEYQLALSRLRAAYFRMREAESTLAAALTAVQDTAVQSHPLVLESAANLRRSWVDLYRCQLKAPVTGLVAQRVAQVGMRVEPGQALMSVIPLDQIWVNANFKETQMSRMKIGQRVRLWSDYYGFDVPFDGEVVGLPGGTGITFSLLPPQNLSGNWIYIVQRLPVRIAIDPEQLKEYPLRLGLSMMARVDLSDQSGSRIPVSGDGSPHYFTDILDQEEAGSEEAVLQVVRDNYDRQLGDLLTQPLRLDWQTYPDSEEEMFEQLLP